MWKIRRTGRSTTRSSEVGSAWQRILVQGLHLYCTPITCSTVRFRLPARLPNFISRVSEGVAHVCAERRAPGTAC